MGQIANRKRIGTTSDFTSIVGKKGDTAVDTTIGTVIVFDGTTPGGNPLAPANTVWPLATSSEPGYMSAAQYVTLATLAAIGNANSSTAGYMSAADYNLLQSLVGSSSGSLPASSGDVPGTLVLRDASGNFAAGVITASLTGNVNGNATTVTNGVVTTGSYSDPAWITSLNANKLFGTFSGTFSGTIPWTSVSGKPTVVSYFTNDAGYINGSGNTTGTSGGVLSAGGRRTASPTPQTVVFRNTSGTAQVATPVNPSDIATKAYVDANAGGFGYYPQTAVNLPSNPIAGGGAVSPFSVIILNETATGYIKYIVFDTVGFSLSASLSSVFIGFTVDGMAETVFNLNEFVFEYGINNVLPNNVILNGGNIYQFKTMMDLPYKISMKIRIFTTGTISVSSTEFQVWISRYLRSS